MGEMLVTVGAGREIRLPEEACASLGIVPTDSLRLVVADGALLLFRADGDRPDEGEADLRDWRIARILAWDEFPYEEPAT